jgi:hypothetical protein
MPYLSEQQRTNMIALVKDLDGEVHCEVVKGQENHGGFVLILSKGGEQVKMDVNEDDLEDAVHDPRTQSEMRWRVKKALEELSRQ